MSKTTTIAKMGPDSSVVEVLTDGSERPIPDTPMRPMTPEGVEEAARADPASRPMTAEEMAQARRVPRIKTLRRALRLTQERIRCALPYPTRHVARLGARSHGARSARVRRALQGRPMPKTVPMR